MIEANTCHENDLRQLVSQSTNDRFILATLGDSKRVVTFYTRSDKPGTEGASYYKELNYWDIPNLVMQIPCELQVLDEMFDHETYELIKIDTQGSELDIMTGGLNLCKRAKFIILEISVIPYNEGAPTADEYYDFMKSLNFIEYACVGEHISNGQVIQRDIAFINQELNLCNLENASRLPDGFLQLETFTLQGTK
jgi:FkbM family methyltransferase